MRPRIASIYEQTTQDQDFPITETQEQKQKGAIIKLNKDWHK